jgi:hypothetical protein
MGYIARRVFEKGLLVPDEACQEMCEEVGPRADDDAVEIVRIALRFHQRFVAALRATIEIRALRRLAHERCDDRVGFVSLSARWA